MHELHFIRIIGLSRLFLGRFAQTQLLVPTEKGLLVLRRADGQPDDRFTGPDITNKVVSVTKWRDQLFLNVGYAWTDFRWPPRTYAEYVNQAILLLPESALPATPGKR